MDLPDVNVLIAAHRSDHPDHGPLKSWLEDLINGHAAFGMAELAAASFLRIVTNPRAFPEPTPMSEALAFVGCLTSMPNCVMIRPGERHFGVFRDLCHGVGVRGNLVTDAYFAALAIESGCRWATRDRDFARFEHLEWFDPLHVTGRNEGNVKP